MKGTPLVSNDELFARIELFAQFWASSFFIVNLQFSEDLMFACHLGGHIGKCVTKHFTCE
jgi:hypothetical protein